MSSIEKLGAFYLGRVHDLDSGETTKDALLYDARDLTTHALIVGMTGSGKTGLAAVMLEEAAIDGIPSLVIDPKGDMGNLLLRFPRMRGEDFRPWIDESEATRKGVSPEVLAQQTADVWKKGLADWGQKQSRVKRFADAAEVSIFTPGSEVGLPLAVLRAFSAPPSAVRSDADALRERVSSAVSGLLGLVGVDADPVTSREHILLSTLLQKFWSEGEDLDLEALIRNVQDPPFDRLGVLDLDVFFPNKDRFALAMQLNNLLASPAFAAWREGQSLDIPTLLHSSDGKPRISVFSIAHLSDPERMFFVTVLLNEIVSWMRTLDGTGSLRALLYMDEIFGFFPPVKSPPSKQPMLTLLKQARAFGLGVVLSSQNPADIDYKGMSNMGSWFLGRLQTARDKERVVAGLETAAQGGLQKPEIESMLSSLGKRVFLMNNVHEDGPVSFQTRWALSYLRGPLTRSQISDLTRAQREQTAPVHDQPKPVRRQGGSARAEQPVLPPSIPQAFVSAVGTRGKLVYRPGLFAKVDMHFVSAKHGLDHWKTLDWFTPIDEDAPSWEDGEGLELPGLLDEPEPDVDFEETAGSLGNEKRFSAWRKKLTQHLYKNRRLPIFRCASLKMVSQATESEGEFRTRVGHAARERRDTEIEKLRQKFAPKLARVEEKIRKAEIRAEKESSQLGSQRLQTAISLGATVVGALFGRKIASAGNVRRAASVARSASRSSREKDDVARARADIKAARSDLKELEQNLEEALESVREAGDPASVEIKTLEIRPRKSDISFVHYSLLWLPYRESARGRMVAAF